MQRLEIRTTVVDGPIALQMRRLEAATIGAMGLQVMSIDQFAVHLAGGFLRSASSEDLDIAVRSALERGGFGDLHALGDFPGAVRAVSRTLRRVWEADLPLAELAAGSPRMTDLALLERRVRGALAQGSLAMPDLVQAAMRRVHLAGRLTGATEFAFLPYVAPAWRPLLEALARHVPVRWSGPVPPGSEGLPGDRAVFAAIALPLPEAVACDDARAEALEALRWARELLATGKAEPRDIAIVAADPRAWDDMMLATRAEADLPLHFSHGVPALETRNGQACAALANLLQQGLSQERIRRVLAHCAARAPGLARLPANALLGVPRDAVLSELAHWRVALAKALPARSDGRDPAPTLLPLLEAADRGLATADETGRLFLPPDAHQLWADALRRAPRHALPITFEALRCADERHPGDSVTWGPARHLAACPRQFARLLGLNARSWPRQESDDPILPAHILKPSRFGVPTIAALDRAAFSTIRAGANGGLTLSRSRRNARGSTLPPSPLLPWAIPVATLQRHRTPSHALGPADRLLARPDDAAADEHVIAATACAVARRSPRANAHDGLLIANHPLVDRALQDVQSATSLKLLLRDPQGYVWRRVLQWSSPPRAASQLTLDPRSHGELVHEILRDAVEALELGTGYASATCFQVRGAVDTAARAAFESWPSRRSTPPRLLWSYAVDMAAEQARRALERDIPLQPSTRSYTEVVFGASRSNDDGFADRKRPWDAELPVSIPGTRLCFGGSIDRLDIRGDGAVQVTDYKTGAIPKRFASMVLDGGRELQRVLYAVAARTLLPDVRSIRARLAFLAQDPARLAVLPDVDGTIARTSRHLALSAASLLGGVSLPGPDADDKWADRRLALPAVASTYSAIKRRAFSDQFGEVGQIWLEL